MKNVLVTGFECFGRYRINPTETILKDLSGIYEAGYTITTMVLPVHIFPAIAKMNYADILLAKAREIHADVIVSLGIASEARGFRLESCATNWIANTTYCTAEENNTCIDPKLCPHEPLYIPHHGLDFVQLCDMCEESGVPIETQVSGTAGTFCCNALMFLLAQAIKKEPNCGIKHYFFHVPCTHASVEGIEFDQKKVLVEEPQLILGVKNILHSLMM